MTKTFHHLSHIDLDGYSCQLVMAQTPHTMISYNANYGAEVMDRLEEIIESLKKNKQEATILITDLNLYPEEAKWLNNEVNRLNDNGWNVTITLLDHHGSGRETAAQYPWYYLDTERCATKITYDYACEHYGLERGGWLEAFVAVVNAVDLWKQNEEADFEYGKVCMRLISEARELSRVMFGDEDRAYKLALLEQAAQMRDLPNAPIVLDEALHKMKKEFFKDGVDNTLDNLSTKYIVALLGTKRSVMTIYYKGWRGFLSYGLGNTSIIGNGFLTEYPDYDFIVDVGTRGTMSLRGHNRVDVAQMAGEWVGGGGHPNAAGGRIQGFKEQFRYDKVKRQMEDMLANKEAMPGKLPHKIEE
ncbi:phosphoesterase [Sulfuricurvum sp. IAE1]|jgi:oligoribonuclease NrnB/cAMP/cGMP phosphodiesterase (DHH superfamily)|uniref:DHH family phosphoesterase n=1 Tax=Sulfuricurvum sp. IAE1 TaxID=2546102 RepID=UPI001042C98C|nr:phosphoesterase [Sulfuricurvum sp. IAE1]MDD3770968.1 phosphoesterase [Sulfuricurvum sp.]MDX9966568.1 phosphoesterase [Sulfuricurvum sp.]TDA64384.1 phosphoesterase [Sulfuricurvum sp. IAE1]